MDSSNIETSIMMGQRELSVMSASYIPTAQPNVIGNAHTYEDSEDPTVQPEPVLRMNSNANTKLCQVVASDLRNFVKSKEDVYIILTIEGQLNLPPYDECTMEFMRDALSGRKRLLTNRELAPVAVPRYKEFNAANLQKAALADEELKLYLPDAGERVINRKFLFNVSSIAVKSYEGPSVIFLIKLAIP